MPGLTRPEKLNSTYATRKRYDQQVAKIARAVQSLGAEYGRDPHAVLGHVKLEIITPRPVERYGHE